MTNSQRSSRRTRGARGPRRRVGLRAAASAASWASASAASVAAASAASAAATGASGLEAMGVPALGRRGRRLRRCVRRVRTRRPRRHRMHRRHRRHRREQRRGRAGRRRRLVGRLQRTRARTLRPGDASIIPFLRPDPPRRVRADPGGGHHGERQGKRGPSSPRVGPHGVEPAVVAADRGSIAVNPEISSQSSSVKFPVKKTRTLDQPSRASLEASTASHV